MIFHFNECFHLLKNFHTSLNFIKNKKLKMFNKFPFLKLLFNKINTSFNWLAMSKYKSFSLGQIISLMGLWGSVQFSTVQSLSHVRLFATPWIAARQASLSITNSQSLLKLMSIELVMPSSHLILCRSLLLLPPISPSIRVFPMSHCLHEVAKVLEFQVQHQSFQWTPRTDL